MLEFYELLKKEKKHVIGLMSGTSVDGIDAAVVEITGHGLETTVNLIAFETFPFPPDVPQRILALCQPDTSRVDDICEMNFYIGHLFAEAVKHTLQKNGIHASDIDLIGSHGQTIHHLPIFNYSLRRNNGCLEFDARCSNPPAPMLQAAVLDKPKPMVSRNVMEGGYTEETVKSQSRFTEPQGKIKIPSTLQIGEPAVIAHETGIPTIADFRVADMAAGGQGAPLVSYPDYLLFHNSAKTVGLLNIGGIANLTVLPANGAFDSVSAADTGPGNMCIDAAVNEITGGRERYDEAGQRAAQGTPYRPLIDEWLEHPFFQLTPPKTTGREMFGHIFAMECLSACRKQSLVDNDVIATLTEIDGPDGCPLHLTICVGTEPDRYTLCERRWGTQPDYHAAT